MGMRGGGGTPGGSAGRLAPPCVVGGFQSALEKDVLLEPGQIGVRALRTELECASAGACSSAGRCTLAS